MKAALPLILQREDVLIASQTGSGKTLAYLLPIVQSMRNEEAELAKLTPEQVVERSGKNKGLFVGCRVRRPRALVIAPTRELAEQIYSVAKELGHHARFRSTLIVGGASLKVQRTVLARAPVDLVIATPKRLSDVHAEESLFFGDVKTVVLDEADTLVSAGFNEVQTLHQRIAQQRRELSRLSQLVNMQTCRSARMLGN